MRYALSFAALAAMGVHAAPGNHVQPITQISDGQIQVRSRAEDWVPISKLSG